MAGELFDVGMFKGKRRSRNNSFTLAEIESAKKSGAFRFAARMRGWAPEELENDFNGRVFRKFVNDNGGRRIIAANIQAMSDDEAASALKAGHFDLIAAASGASIEYWAVRVRRNGYRAGTGWARRVPSFGTRIPLAEDGYLREVGFSLTEVIRRHNILSNRFAEWLPTQGYSGVIQEAGGVDVEFCNGRDLCRAELKICEPIGTTKSIREALGQLLEYNHFGKRKPANLWFIVLDQTPGRADILYLRTLRNRYGLPLSLIWQAEKGFHVEPLDQS